VTSTQESRMRSLEKMAIVALGVLVILGCARAPETDEAVADDEIGLTPTSVFDTPDPLVPATVAKDPGENELLGAYFSGSPPVIPHRIDDFVPIRIGENMCLECHDLPDQIGVETVAGDPTPMPASHYRDDDAAAGASGARFTCTQCHAPQTDAEPLVANTYRQ
jgi:cytochrome c-type protein NapB